MLKIDCNKRRKVTMVHKILIAFLLGISAAVTHAESSMPEIKREQHLNVLPTSEVSGKRIFIEFDGSPKTSQVLQEKLRSRGFNVVATAGDADAHFKVGGAFAITGGGKEEVRGKLGELLESSAEAAPSNSPDYRHQNIDLVQIAAGRAYTGFISVTDMVRWLGKKTGIVGRFNEMLTGDPRGFCWHESCSKFTSSAIVSVKGDSGHWWLQESAQDAKVVLDLVVADAIESALKPIYDIKPASGR